MKTIRDYINLITEAQIKGGWKYQSEMTDPMPVPGTEYSIFAWVYYWQQGYDGSNRIELTDTRKNHYLLKIEILDTQYEDQIEDMDLDTASKIIQAAFPKLVKKLGIMTSYDLYRPDLGKIVAGNQNNEEDMHNFYASVTHTIDQT